MQAAERICHEREWHYFVHTEQTLPQGAELANLLALIAYRPSGYADVVVQKWLEQAMKEKILPLGQLVKSIATTTHHEFFSIYPSLYHEIWHGRLQIDWQRMLLQDGAPVLSTLVTGGSL
jgi:hypothetical protein